MNKLKQLYNDIRDIHEMFRSIFPKKTWDSVWLNRKYLKAIKETHKIRDIHHLRVDLNYSENRLGVDYYAKLVKILNRKRHQALITAGYVG